MSYMKASGWKACILAMCFHALYSGGMIYSNIWLSQWSNDATANYTDARGQSLFRLNVYFGVTAASGKCYYHTIPDNDDDDDYKY